LTVSITRSGGRTPPPDRERLEIADDGTFTMWRSVRSPVVGRFGGGLDEGLSEQVRELAAAASAVEPPAEAQVPGAATETVTIDGVSFRTGSSNDPPGPWGGLVEALRSWLRELTNSPVAAVALEVAGDGSSAKLVHRGDDTIAVDLSSLSVRAVVWGPGWEQRGDWSAGPSTGDARVEAGPGWSYDLPFEHGLVIAPGDALHVFARFGLFDGDTAVAALASIDPSPGS
jgi:hypothetical protein